MENALAKPASPRHPSLFPGEGKKSHKPGAISLSPPSCLLPLLSVGCFAVKTDCEITDQWVSLRLSKATPQRASPSNNTVAPPSGTVVPFGTALAEAENIQEPGFALKDSSCRVRLQDMLVGVQFVALMMPVPLTTTNPLTPAVPPWLVTDEESNSNVNPPTDQNLLIGLVVSKFQTGDEKSTEAPGKIEANEPVGGRLTVGETHAVTSVALAAEPLLYVTPPLKPMAPVIGVACSDCVNTNATAAMPANLTILFTLLLGKMIELG